MSFVGDAIKDVLPKRGRKTTLDKKQEELIRLRELEAELEAEIDRETPQEMEEQEQPKTIKVEEMPPPPQYNADAAKEEDTTKDKEEITLNDVLSDLEARLHRIEKIIEFMIYRR